MKKFLILVAYMFVLPAFATQTTIIENADAKVMSKELTKFYVKNNCQVENIQDYSFTAKEPVSGTFSQLMLSPNGMAGSAKYKYDYVFLQDGKNVIVSFTGTTISNDQSVTRFSTPWNYFNEKQHLIILKRLFEGYYDYGFKYELGFNCLKITELENKESFPLSYGDKVKKVNGIKVMSLSRLAMQELFYPTKNVPLTLEIKRNKDLITVELPAIWNKPVIRKK